MKNLANFTDPPILTHLKRLTTKDGIIQHADREVPDPTFGYSIDDNARALIACLWYDRLFKGSSIMNLAEIYFDYIKKVEKDGGSFHNFLSFTEKILDGEGSEDSIGRTFWALGETIALAPDEQMRLEAVDILNRTKIDRHLDHAHLRTKAYILLGLLAAKKTTEAKPWADKLVDMFTVSAKDDWEWFEDSLRYANGIVPYALAKAWLVLRDPDYLKVGERSFDWLNRQSYDGDIPAPIGQNGWYFKGGEKSLYDQQPLDAADMVLAAAALYEATKKPKYLQSSLEWMSWYDGGNMQAKSLINYQTNGVHDALTAGGVNENQGAESIITYLMAYLEMSYLAKNND